ncbi:MAG: glycosyltransferase family 25 protein [Acidimicrobiales bacterium]
MEATVPPQLRPIYTSDWDGPFDGHELDRAVLDDAGFALFPWRIPSDNPWWSRPLKLGEIGCTIAHWTCWRDALENGYERFVLVLEDDAVLLPEFADALCGALDHQCAPDHRCKPRRPGESQNPPGCRSRCGPGPRPRSRRRSRRPRRGRPG